MKLKSLSIQNFRGYHEKTTIIFEDFTAIIGRNDIGKSTILEALDIFFNDGKGAVKIDKDDVNIIGRNQNELDIIISACFTDLPSNVIIDASNETDLASEYLLNSNGELEIIKTFKNGATTTAAFKICINALHPQNQECSNLLCLKQANLKKKFESLNLVCDDQRKNSLLRKAIWDKYNADGVFQLYETSIDVNSKDGDINAIWNKLKEYLPCFSLFQSDRKNTDSDSEIQDPLKEAVKQIMSAPDLQERLDYVADKVREQMQIVMTSTLNKIKEMDEEIANSLSPQIPATKDLKWSDIFKSLTIAGDQNIPINKRGSGIKRLILLNFFRADAESRMQKNNKPNIIYAIEEPETSQHKRYQLMLIRALKTIVNGGNAQIMITTHSSDIVRSLEFDQLRLVCNEATSKCIKTISRSSLPFPSLYEVNYLAFDDVTEGYHNELYGYIQSKACDEDPNNEREKAFEAWLVQKGCTQSKQWIRIIQGQAKQPQPVTLCTYIRNSIHHPENDKNDVFTDAELRSSIIKMREIIAGL